MDNREMERILVKLDKIEDRLDSIDKTLIKNTESLEYHIKRTDLLQEQVKTLDTNLKPVEDHVKSVNLIISIVKWVGFPTTLAIIGYLIQGFIK